MRFLSFKEYVVAREGLLLPSRPAAPGLSRINTTPLGNARRARLVANPFRPRR
jgi:hypothetical protein